MKTALRLIAAAALAGSAVTAFANSSGIVTTYSVPVTSANNGVNPETRWYKIYQPQSYSKTSPTALVIVLHGGGLSYNTPLTSTAQQSVWTTYSPSIADSNNLIVAIPNGFNPNSTNGGFSSTTNQLFNDCTGDYKGYTNASGTLIKVDDVAFMQAMISQIESNSSYNIDPKRIYVVGVSNGATMALRLAREASGTYAAAGIALGGEGATPTLGLSDQCQYAPTLNSSGTGWIANPEPNPVPLWMIKGTLDPFVVYTGGQATGTSGSYWLPYERNYTGNQTDPNICYSPANATTTPASTTVQGLLGLRYSLNSTPSSTYTYPGATQMLCPGISGKTITVSSTVSCNNYTNSTTARSEVDDCTVPYGGHIEPSNLIEASLIVQAVTGNQNITLDTATEEWKFFQRFTHP